MNIKELAEQAGFDIEKTMYGERVFVDGRGITEELIRFAELVAAAEREACAKLCEGFPMPNGILGAHPEYLNGKRMAVTQCAESIRARGDKHDI